MSKLHSLNTIFVKRLSSGFFWRIFVVVPTILSFVFSFMFYVASANAADGIRKTINFQGKLVDQNGLNVANGNYTVVFTLYDDPSAGSNLWDETQTVSTTDGIFQVELGSVDTTLGNVNFNSDQLYLGIKVGADSEMTPRIRFTAVPYAFNAQKVNGLTVANTSGNPFSSATTLQIAEGKTLVFNNGLTFSGTDSTTITFQGTDTYVGRTTTDTLTNKTIGSTGLIFSGAATDITSAANENLTFTPNGSGSLILNADFNSGVAIGAVGSTPAVLSVSGGLGSNAALIVDQTNSGDIFAASQSGTTRFRVANNGDVFLSSGINLGGTVGTETQCIIGGANASWGSCGSGGSGDNLLAVYAISAPSGTNVAINFNGAANSLPSSASGTITFPSNTEKLMVEVKGAGGGGGGTGATNAIKNAGGGGEGGYSREYISNVGSNYYIKVGGGGVGGTNGATGATGTSTCFGTNASDACTSPLLSASGGVGGVGINAVGVAAGGNGGAGAGGDINMTGQPGFNSSAVANASWGGAGGGIAGGRSVTAAGNGNAGANGGGGAGAGGITASATARNGGVGGDGYMIIYVYKNPGSNDLGDGWNQFANGVLAPDDLTTDVLIGGNATTSAKFGFLNVSGSNSPTASISAGLTGALYLTAGGAIQTTANQSLVLGGTTTGNILLNPQGQNFVGIGTANPLAPLDVRTSIGTVPTASFSANSSFAAFVINNSGRGDLFTASSSGLNRFVIKQNGDVGIGTTLPIANFDLRGFGNYATYVASLSGNTGKAILTVDNNGVGDVFTASKSGATKFTILNSGDLRLANYTTTGGFLYTNNTGTVLQTVAGNAGECLKSAGGSTPTWGSCTGASAAYWDLQNGLLYNGNLTTDFAVGGNSSISAKFKVSMSGTQPTASVSGNTAKASLIVDNTGFGDLLTASKSGATKFTVLNSGDVRINNLLSCDVKTDSSGLLTCGTDATGAGGTNYLKLNNGTFSLINNTADVLLGGDATSSAKFAFMNLNSNSGSDPLASFSGTLRLGAKANSSVTQQTTWTAVSNAAGQIDNGGTSGIASISAMASYNGSMYVGTYGTSAGTAEVYRYDGTPGNWTRVSFGAGQIASGGTTAIASVSAMTIFDGRLYVGTSKVAQAEVYRYEGGTNWTKVTNATPGTICGTAGIDGVSSMAVYQGSLFVGTRDLGGAEVCRYLRPNSWERINSASGNIGGVTGIPAIAAMTATAKSLYIGTAHPNAARIFRYAGGQGATTTFVAVNGTAGQFRVNGANITAIDEIAVMTVYNGAVVAGVKEPNNADVIVLNEGINTGASDSFTRLNNIAGNMTTGGTTAIDGVMSMTVYNGILHVGTLESNSAEIYRYTGGDQRFFKISQSSAGQIASGGTTAIDGAVKLLASNGDLYVGTLELGRAEVYRHTSSIDRSYGLEFVANPQVAGGTQNMQLNHGSIFFLASGSANLSANNANTGAFIFSHGIQTRNGSYDVAEDYPTRDESLEAGDLVSIDPNERGFVIKSAGISDRAVLGVYSENPALRLSQQDATIDGARAVPIALAGRVPVKVSTESGAIKPGDYLTASSIPGVAMKATKAGGIIGQSMATFDGQETSQGRVLTYIKSSSYLGSIASSFADFDVTSVSSGKDLLTAIHTQAVTDSASEIVTDALVAGLHIVSPEITTTKLQLQTMEAVEGSTIDVMLGREGALVLKGESGNAGISLSGNGNASFAGTVQVDGLSVVGTITADKLKVNTIEITTQAWKQAFIEGGLEARLMSQEMRLAQLENKTASASADQPASSQAALLANITKELEASETAEELYQRTIEDDVTETGRLIADSVRVTGSAIIEGIVHVVDTLTVKQLIVDRLATFLGDVVFSGDVLFKGRPTFSNDTAGLAVVKKGTDRVVVTFEKVYDTVPMVSATITVAELSPVPNEAIENLLKRQEAHEKSIFNSNVRFLITKRTAKSFVIMLDKLAEEDITFSWMAFASSDPIVHSGNGVEKISTPTRVSEMPYPISSIAPTLIPTSSFSITSMPTLPPPEETTKREEVSQR